ncbi:MAG: hypothetical protein Q9169_006024 [Polycauliona sp. 2 TL-2023]
MGGETPGTTNSAPLRSENPIEESHHPTGAASIADAILSASLQGATLSRELYTLADYVENESPRFRDIAGRVSITATRLQTLEDVPNKHGNVLNHFALRTLHDAALVCQDIFTTIDQAAKGSLEQCQIIDLVQKTKSATVLPDGPKLYESKADIKKTLQPIFRVYRFLWVDWNNMDITLLFIAHIKRLAESGRIAHTDENTVSELRGIYRISLLLEEQAHECARERLRSIMVGSAGVRIFKQEFRAWFDANDLPELGEDWGKEETKHEKRNEEQAEEERGAQVKGERAAEEGTVIPLTGSYTMLSGNESFSPPLSPTYGAARGKPSEVNELIPAGEASSSPKKTQDDINLASPPDTMKLSNDVADQDKPKEGTKLHLFHLQTIVRDDYDGIFLTWTVSELLVSQAIIQDHLDKSREEGLPSIIEAYQELTRHEREAIRIKLELYFSPTLVSLKRTYTDITHRGIAFGHVPALQFVVSHAITQPFDLPPSPASAAIDSKKELELSRPTFIKCHKKHLCPETLDTYNLPWCWDEGDPNYVIVKKWLTEVDQDILFEHTRKLRQLRQEKSRRVVDDSDTDDGDNVSLSLRRYGPKDVITVKDSLSRTHIFPLEMCKTWTGICKLLTEAYRSNESMRSMVAGGHYHLLTPNGEIILPKVWHAIVSPGLALTLQLRPGSEQHLSKDDSPVKSPIHIPASSHTKAEEHDNYGHETAKVEGVEGDASKYASTTQDTDVDNAEVKRVVEELLKKYTVQPDLAIVDA